MSYTPPLLDLSALREHVAAAEKLGTNADVANDTVLALISRAEAAEAKVAAVRELGLIDATDADGVKFDAVIADDLRAALDGGA